MSTKWPQPQQRPTLKPVPGTRVVYMYRCIDVCVSRTNVGVPNKAGTNYQVPTTGTWYATVCFLLSWRVMRYLIWVTICSVTCTYAPTYPSITETNTSGTRIPQSIRMVRVSGPFWLNSSVTVPWILGHTTLQQYQATPWSSLQTWNAIWSFSMLSRTLVVA